MDREYAGSRRSSTIFVVVDVDNCKAIKAFRDEYDAEDYADNYYARTGIDTRVDRCGLVEG